MTELDRIEKLKQAAKINPVANAVFHVFASRERARNQVTVASLAKRMAAEGFNYPAAEYPPVLELLASLGFGHLVKNKAGQAVALKDVKVTLQSIGLAACGQAPKLQGFQPRRRFGKLRSVPRPAAQPRVLPVKEAARPITVIRRRTGNPPLVLTFVVPETGKAINISIPDDWGKEDVAELVGKLHK